MKTLKTLMLAALLLSGVTEMPTPEGLHDAPPAMRHVATF